MICYHFCSKNTLFKIKKDGFLKPNTKLFLKINIEKLYKKYGMSARDYEKVKKFAGKLPHRKFIVAIPKNRLKDWEKSGLIKEVYYFLKPDYRLGFEIPKNCRIFAREHIHQSPQEIKRKYNKTAYTQIPESYKTSIWVKYFKSTKIVKVEKDFKNIKVPELWLNCKIPLDEIKIVRIKRS